MYGLRNSELSTCLFQFSHKMRQTMLLYAYFTPRVDLAAILLILVYSLKNKSTSHYTVLLNTSLSVPCNCAQKSLKY